MNVRQWLMTGCIALIIPAAVIAQPPGGFGGGRGGFSGGQGGGRRGGGFTGRSMFGDPDQMFNRWSNGKDVIDLNAVPEFMKPILEGMMQRAGMTAKDGKITRQDYKAAMEKMRSGMGAGSFGGRQRGPDRQQNLETEASAEFDKLDTDKDGQLSASEMTGALGESLAAERDKWDSNQDGIISRAEFQSFYAARKRQQQNEDKGNDRSAREDRGRRDDTNPDRRSIVVYRADNVPKEVSSFFSKYDTDQDAQISLYEWRMGGGDIDEFKKMDRSGDNLLTVEEALLYVHLHQDSTIAAAGDASGNRRGGMFGGNGGSGRTANFTIPGGFNRTSGGQFPGRGNFQGPGGNGGQNPFANFSRFNRGGDNGNSDNGNGFSRNRGGNRGNFGGNRGSRGGRRGGFGGGNDNGGGND